MSLKDLVGKRVSKQVKFMGESITVNKLSVDEVMELQKEGKDLNEDSPDGLRILRRIIRSSVDEAKELTDEEFNQLPLADLAALSTDIMSYSGMGADPKAK